MDNDKRWAVLPVKPFDWAKSRLDGVLTAAERAALARQLMLGSLAALIESRCFVGVLVVSRDAEALALAEQQGAQPLAEDAPANLNTAISAARAVATRAGAESLLVLASDLPLVRAEDILRVVAAAATATAVVVPDRRAEGTNALLLTPPDLIEPAFGLQSFARHLALLADAGAVTTVLRLERIAFDLDLPEDLAELEMREGYL